MNLDFETIDGRLVARVILLGHRFGCSYDRLTVKEEQGRFSVQIHLTGPELALRRLNAQVGKLLDYEKETA